MKNRVSRFFCACVLLSPFAALRASATAETAEMPQFPPHLRQEVKKTEGVFSCGPNKTDEYLFKFLGAHGVYTVEAYAAWLEKTISYQADPATDSWATPLSTLRAGKGDCEDYAFLTQSVLRVLGYAPIVCVMGGIGTDHAICVFREKGYYMWFDNASCNATFCTTLEDFAKKIIRDYDSLYLLRLNQTTGSREILMRRTDL